MMTPEAKKDMRWAAVTVASLAGGIALITGVARWAEDSLDNNHKEITACPTEYDGLVVVNDDVVLVRLGEIAKAHEVRVSGSSDYAISPGELACKAIIDYGTGETETVLLPAGMQALDQDNQGMVVGKSYLPDGLVWRS